MTWEELKLLIRQCLLKGGMSKNVVDAFVESAGQARAASYAAEKLWLNQVPEDIENATLRKQLLALSKHGQFDLED